MSRQGWVVDFSLSFRPPCLLESCQEKVSRVLFAWCCGSSPQYFPSFSLGLSLIRGHLFFQMSYSSVCFSCLFFGWGRCLQMKNEGPRSPHRQPMIAAVWCFVCVCCRFSCSLWAWCERGAEERAIPQSACCFRCAFSFMGSRDCLIDLASLALPSSPFFPHFLSQALLFPPSMHPFVSDSFSLIWEKPVPPPLCLSSSQLQSFRYDHEANAQSS